jgi:hypothetical protein
MEQLVQIGKVQVVPLQPTRHEQVPPTMHVPCTQTGLHSAVKQVVPVNPVPVQSQVVADAQVPPLLQVMDPQLVEPQSGPEVPATQLQLLGAMQVPPLRHPLGATGPQSGLQSGERYPKLQLQKFQYSQVPPPFAALQLLTCSQSGKHKN